VSVSIQVRDDDAETAIRDGGEMTEDIVHVLRDDASRRVEWRTYEYA
jgi:hypothetical protein